MKKTIESTIDIHATPEKIWSVLLETSRYGTWNPFIRSINGMFVVGNKIQVVLNPPGGGVFKFKPLVLSSEFPEIRWRGQFIIRGLFDGEHYFRLEAVTPKTTRFIHGENFSGFLVGLLGGFLEKFKVGFEVMNDALKVEAEKF